MDKEDRAFYWQAVDLKTYHGQPFPTKADTRFKLALSWQIEDTCDRLCLTMVEMWSTTRRHDYWGIAVQARDDDDEIVELELSGNTDWVCEQIETWARAERCARPDSPFVPLIKQARAGERGHN